MKVSKIYSPKKVFAVGWLSPGRGGYLLLSLTVWAQSR